MKKTMPFAEIESFYQNKRNKTIFILIATVFWSSAFALALWNLLTIIPNVLISAVLGFIGGFITYNSVMSFIRRTVEKEKAN